MIRKCLPLLIAFLLIGVSSAALVEELTDDQKKEVEQTVENLRKLGTRGGIEWGSVVQEGEPRPLLPEGSHLIAVPLKVKLVGKKDPITIWYVPSPAVDSKKLRQKWALSNGNAMGLAFTAGINLLFNNECVDEILDKHWKEIKCDDRKENDIIVCRNNKDKIVLAGYSLGDKKSKFIVCRNNKDKIVLAGYSLGDKKSKFRVKSPETEELDEKDVQAEANFLAPGKATCKCYTLKKK